MIEEVGAGMYRNDSGDYSPISFRQYDCQSEKRIYSLFNYVDHAISNKIIRRNNFRRIYVCVAILHRDRHIAPLHCLQRQSVCEKWAIGNEIGHDMILENGLLLSSGRILSELRGVCKSFC